MLRDPIRQAIERAAFFRAVGPEELHLLHATMRRRTLEPGAVLFRQGDQGNSMVLLSHGQLSVRFRDADGRERELELIEPSEVVGEMACIDPAPRSASVVAVEPSIVYELDQHLLSYLRRQAPSLMAAVVGSVIAQLTERLRHTNLRIETELDRLAGGAQPPQANLPRLPSGPPPERHLGSVPLVDLHPLRGLAEADLARLSSVAPARVWKHKALLCHEGDHADSCFLVVAGEVDVVKAMRGKRRRLATLPPGSLVGQAALVDRAPRSAILRARGTVVAFELHRSTFERLLAQANPLALRFQEEIAIAGIRQLRSANKRLSQLLAKSPGQAASAATLDPSSPAPPPRPAPTDPLHEVQAALSEWGMRVEDLESIQYVSPDGIAGAAESAARKRRG